MCLRCRVCMLGAAVAGCACAAPAYGAGGDGGQFVVLGMKTAAMLALTLALLLIVAYGLKRWNLFGSRMAGGRRRLRIVDSLYLAPKNSLAIVHVDDQDILVGITPSSISYLASLPPRQDDAAGTCDNVQQRPDRQPAETITQFVRHCRGLFTAENAVTVAPSQDSAPSRCDQYGTERT